MSLRFAVCCATYTELAQRVLPHDLKESAPAVGHAFAVLFAILKNSHRRRASRASTEFKSNGVSFRDDGEVEGRVFIIGGYRVRVTANKAFVQLGNKWIEGDRERGMREIQRVPIDIILEILRLPVGYEHDRKAFRLYQEIRDKFGL